MDATPSFIPIENYKMVFGISLRLFYVCLLFLLGKNVKIIVLFNYFFYGLNLLLNIQKYLNAKKKKKFQKIIKNR